MKIKILGHEVYRIDLKARMPFRYGIAVMTEMPEVFVRIRVEIDGGEYFGISADCLPPKWFTKISDKPPGEEIEEMLRVIQHALSISIGLQGDSPFWIWQQVYNEQAAWGKAEQLPPLLCHFGTSLFERALLEAFCRGLKKSFAQLLHRNSLGLSLGAIHPILQGTSVADFLPAEPLSKIIVRHTVGLGDPLTDKDIAPEDRLVDGLPQSLSASIRKYGLRHFKIKVTGNLEHDLQRLQRLAVVIPQQAEPGFAFSLDGNEQFKSMADFQAYWENLCTEGSLKEFFQHLLFVEQPVHRAYALQPNVGSLLSGWKDGPPVIIDESDGTLGDLPLALSLGYAGTSHKNCKGIFKGVANRCLLAHLQKTDPHRRLLMSGEDLCNIGPVALLQDLAVMAALGISSVERNGHHYHAGLSQFPGTVQQQVLSHHSDLYGKSPEGWPALNIAQGEIQLGSINRAPLGVGFPLDLEQFKLVFSDSIS